MKEVLTEKQKRFCDYYLETGNATEAARKAGYKGNNLNRVASENLTKPYIKEYVNEGLRKQEEERKKEGQIKLNADLVDKLLEIFNGDVIKMKKNIERVLTKEYLIDDLTEEEMKSLLRRKPIDETTRYAVMKRAGFKCQCCGEKPNKDNDVVLHIDHIIPYSLGGKDTIDNLQVLCLKCNESKKNNFIDNHNIGWEGDNVG